MSSYPPYNPQPYGLPVGPYMPVQPFQPRPDMQGAAPMPQPTQASQVAQQGPQMPPTQQGGIMGFSPASRPVTSREEAMGVAADFSGAPMIFQDVTHDRVYIKRWDLASGGPVFQDYARVLPAPAEPERHQAPEEVAWVSLQDFQDLQDLVKQLQGEIDRLKKPAGKAATKNDADK